MGRDTLEKKLSTPISVFDMGDMKWSLFWYKSEYDDYMAKWHEQQAKQIRTGVKIT